MMTTATNALALIGSTELSRDTSSPEYREEVQQCAAELARIFAESTSEIRFLWGEIRNRCNALDDALKFGSTEQWPTRKFDLDLHYQGSRYSDYPENPAVDAIIKKMNVKMWQILIDRLGIKNLMSIKRRNEFEEQINRGDVPAVTEANIMGLVFGLADRAAEFATESARETLELLTPRSGHYATNSGFKIGRRVILTWCVEQKWNDKAFRPFYNREKEMIAIDGTFHILDEKGVIKGHTCPLIQAIDNSPNGRGETDYFRFKCFKNHNFHIEFKRIDLVKKLNGLATGEYVLGQDTE